MNKHVTCCICDDLVEPPYNELGGRVYCSRHFDAVSRSNSGFWQATLIQILGMAVFAALVAVIATNLGELSPNARIGFGLFLALVPSLLWILYFYRQDRLEPEPKTKVAAVFVTALVLTDVAGLRLINEFFDLARWATSDTLTSVLSSVLIIGFIRQAITYIAIRLVVYNTPEFDERMDGIVYGTVAGLGIAALLNLRYIIDNQGVELAPGVVQTTTTALAQASFSGLLGYFMAEAKFTHRPVWYVPCGLVVSAVANGLFSWLIREVGAVGLEVEYWRSLLFGIVVALIAFGVLVLLMRRSTEITFTRPRDKTAR
jgi:RsiW-degrading membrane proteinase PrsW (M82 family)